MKNKFLIILIYLTLSLCTTAFSEQFEFEVSKIEIIEKNKIFAINGKAISKDKNLEIAGKKFEYNKDLKILNVFNGDVLIKSNNIKINFETMFVDEKKLIMSAKGNVIINDLNNNLVFKTEIINFDRSKNILSSPTESVFEDNFNNNFKASRFEYKINENAILPMELPDTFGFDSFLSHVGEISNKGIELSINWNNKLSDNFLYSIESNIAYNKNELSKISNQFFANQIGGGINNGQYTKKVSLGQPLGSFFLYEVAGIDDKGQFVYKDLNGDQEINEDDRRFYGSFIPSITAASNFKVEFKNFDLNLNIYGSFDNKVYNGKKAQRFGNENIEKYVFNNRWTTLRPSKNTSRASNSIPLSSNYFLESGDFLRINNITLGYTIESKKSKIFKKIRTYATAKNPLILKRFSGFTPELP